MPLLLLLLLVLLRPGSSLGLQPPETPDRGDEDDWEGYDDGYITDPPETLGTTPGAVTPRPELRAAAAGTVTAGGDAGGATSEKLGVEVATEGVPVTPGPPNTERGATLPPATEAPSTAGAPSTEGALSTTEAPSTAGAPSTELATTEALPTEPLPTPPAATEVPAPSPAATEALTTEPPTTPPAATEALTTETPTTTAAPPLAPTPTGTQSKESLSTEALSTASLVLSDPHGGATAAVPDSSDASIRRGKSSGGRSPPGSSPAPPAPTRGPEYMSVKHCLLAILLLALVATTFLVCTVVLAVRLSRRNHMYHVRSYSPTEMVCISALLPEGGEAPGSTANGTLPAAAAQGPGLREGPGEEHSGDDLTLQSFLP